MGISTLLWPIAGWLLVLPLLGIWGTRRPHFANERPRQAAWAVAVYGVAASMSIAAGWWLMGPGSGFVFRLVTPAAMSVIAWTACQYFLSRQSPNRRRRAELAIGAVLGISALLAVVPQYGRWEAAAGALLFAAVVYGVNGLMGHIADGLLDSIRVFLIPNQCQVCGGRFEVASIACCPSCDAPLRGQCVRCGYDLTGNATGRCPECGTDATARLFRFDLSRFSHSHCPACGHNSSGRASHCPNCGFAPLTLKSDEP